MKTYQNEELSALLESERAARLGPDRAFHAKSALFGMCMCCNETTFVAYTPSRTVYRDDKLNAQLLLCEECTARHHEEMDQLWASTY